MRKKCLLTLWALLFVLSANAVKVVFRLDDPRISYDSVHHRILELFIKNDVPLSVAVVPCTKDGNSYELNHSDYWECLNNPNIEITLHGLTHEDINGNGEFGGLSPDESNNRIRNGKKILSGYFEKPINTFIPPFNATNASISSVLKANGINILSADMFQQVKAGTDIQYYPETLGHLMSKKGIWNATVETLKNTREKNAVCVIMFHAYDLQDTSSWNQLKEILSYCKSDSNVELYTFSSLYDSGETSNWLRYRANQFSSGLSKIFLNQGVLHSTWLCVLIHVINALIHVLLSIIGVLLLFFFNSHSTVEKTSYCIVLVGVGMFVFCIAWFHWLSPLKLLLLSMLMNIPILLVGWIICTRRTTREK